jgi:hypothetical protein
MGWVDIASQVVLLISSVDDTGVVQFWPRARVDLGEIQDAFGTSISDKSSIRAWFVSRTAVSNTRENAPLQKGWRDHAFLIQGFLSFSEEKGSTETFGSLIDAILDSFEPHLALNNSCFWVSGLEVRKISVEMLGPIRCNYCEMELTAREERSVVYTA